MLRPEGGYGWVIVFCALMMHFIVFGIWNTSGLLFVEISESLQTGKAETALISSITLGAMLMSGPISSVLSNVLGHRMTSVLGSLLSSVGFVVGSFGTKLYVLWITLGGLVGLGFGISFIPFIVNIGFYFERRKSLAVGITVCGVGLGTIAYAPLVEILLIEYGWRGTTLILGGLVLNVAVLGLLLKPVKEHHDPNLLEKQEKPCYDYKNENGNINQNGNESYLSEKMLPNDVPINQQATDIKCNSRCCRQIFKHFDCSIFKNPSFIIFLLSNFLAICGMTIPFIYLPDRAIENGRTKSESAILISVIGFTNIFGRIIVAYFGDRPFINRRLIYILSLVISGIVNILNPLNDSFVYLILYSSFCGFFMGLFYTLFLVLAMDMVYLHQIGNAVGAVILVHGLAALISPSIIGWLYTLSGSYDVPFYVTGSLILIGGLSMCLAKGKMTTLSEDFL